MRILAAAGLLLLASCGADNKQIIEDVCKPINQDENASLEKLAATKGYDVEEVRTVCRQYVRDQVQEAEKAMRELGVR